MATVKRTKRAGTKALARKGTFLGNWIAENKLLVKRFEGMPGVSVIERRQQVAHRFEEFLADPALLKKPAQKLTDQELKKCSLALSSALILERPAKRLRRRGGS